MSDDYWAKAAREARAAYNTRKEADEIARLRAELAAVTAERDRMQILHDEAYIAGMKHGWNCCAAGHEERYKRTVENTREQIRRARAALEGVTEPASPWRDIESAPKDGTWIFIYKNNWPVAIEAKWDEIDDVDGLSMGWVFQDEFYYIGVATGRLGYNEDIKDGHMPTHWMPLPEPPR